MSLTAMIHGQGVVGCFEGVSAETMAKYNIDNGPVVMAMECAELLNTAFMEGFYTVNDVEISAAMEGYQSVTESSEKAGKVKAALVKAGKAIADAFRKMGSAIRGFFANIGEKIKEKALASDRFFNSIPGSVKTITYEGYEFTGLTEVGNMLYRLNPSDALTCFQPMDDIISSKNDDDDVEDLVSGFKEAWSEKMIAVKKEYGISDKTSLSDGFWSYFRSGAIHGQRKEYKIAVSEVRKLVKGGDKYSKELDKISKNIEKEYLDYAAKCEKNADGSNSSTANAWRAMASAARELNTFTMTLVSAWTNAYSDACSQWASGAREYIKKEKKGDSGDGEE